MCIYNINYMNINIDVNIFKIYTVCVCVCVCTLHISATFLYNFSRDDTAQIKLGYILVVNVQFG